MKTKQEMIVFASEMPIKIGSSTFAEKEAFVLYEPCNTDFRLWPRTRPARSPQICNDAQESREPELARANGIVLHGL